MRFFIAIIIFLSTCSAYSQDIEFPPRCYERILTPRVEALCTDLRTTSISADERYLTALSKVDSLEKWNALESIRLQFMASYYECSTKGNTQAVTACLTPAFQEVLSQLPPTTGATEPQLSALRMQARQVNDLVATRVRDLFHKCAFARIDVIDDGISPARDIAQGVGKACQPQATKWAQMRFATLSISLFSSVPPMSDTLRLIEQIVSPDNLVETVLEYRASKRSKAQPQKKGAASRKVEG